MTNDKLWKQMMINVSLRDTFMLCSYVTAFVIELFHLDIYLNLFVDNMLQSNSALQSFAYLFLNFNLIQSLQASSNSINTHI